MGDVFGEISRKRWWLLAGALMAVYLAVRLPGLMALPIFGDEAIYIRWSQWVARGDWFECLKDPKPPLHFWIMAPFLWLSNDPLKVARGVSVAAGLLTIPAVMSLCWQLVRLVHAEKASGLTWGIVSAVLFIFCPFLAFYQRLGVAESLVILESVVMLWLGAKLAGQIWDHRKGGWGVTCALGMVIGGCFLTRQIVSCIFPLLVLLLFVFFRPGVNAIRPALKAFGLRYFCALLIGLVIWTPNFLGRPQAYHPDGNPAAEITRASFSKELGLRIFYQSGFSKPQTWGERADQMAINAKKVFVPNGKELPSGDYKTGWLWVYLTPTIYIGTALAILWLGIRKEFRVLAMLLIWFVAMIGPLILFGQVLYSRYALGAVPPLLLLLSLGIVDFLTWLAGKLKKEWLTPAVGFAIVVLLLFPAMNAMMLQARNWSRQEMVARDRYQYVTGWTCGIGAKQAADYLRAVAKTHSVVVITGPEWGPPADVIWAYLEGTPNVTLYWREHEPQRKILAAEANGSYMLGRDKWQKDVTEPVRLPDGATIYYVINHPFHLRNDVDVPAVEHLAAAGNHVEDLTIYFPARPVQTPESAGEEVMLLLLDKNEQLTPTLPPG